MFIIEPDQSIDISKEIENISGNVNPLIHKKDANKVKTGTEISSCNALS